METIAGFTSEEYTRSLYHFVSQWQVYEDGKCHPIGQLKLGEIEAWTVGKLRNLGVYDKNSDVNIFDEMKFPSPTSTDAGRVDMELKIGEKTYKYESKNPETHKEILNAIKNLAKKKYWEEKKQENFILHVIQSIHKWGAQHTSMGKIGDLLQAKICSLSSSENPPNLFFKGEKSSVTFTINSENTTFNISTLCLFRDSNDTYSSLAAKENLVFEIPIEENGGPVPAGTLPHFNPNSYAEIFTSAELAKEKNNSKNNDLSKYQPEDKQVIKRVEILSEVLEFATIEFKISDIETQKAYLNEKNVKTDLIDQIKSNYSNFSKKTKEKLKDLDKLELKDLWKKYSEIATTHPDIATTMAKKAKEKYKSFDENEQLKYYKKLITLFGESSPNSASPDQTKAIEAIKAESFWSCLSEKQIQKIFETNENKNLLILDIIPDSILNQKDSTLKHEDHTNFELREYKRRLDKLISNKKQITSLASQKTTLESSKEHEDPNAYPKGVFKKESMENRERLDKRIKETEYQIKSLIENNQYLKDLDNIKKTRNDEYVLDLENLNETEDNKYFLDLEEDKSNEKPWKALREITNEDLEKREAFSQNESKVEQQEKFLTGFITSTAKEIKKMLEENLCEILGVQHTEANLDKILSSIT
ncbi:MAG: hypothetical protein LBI56_01885 [Puniceicoccales bacterium]|nr:hypothetical protein [Puniceicoccales bacterium]